MAQRRHVVDQMLGRIVGQRRCCVIIARTGRALAATTLVEKHDAVPLRIEKPDRRAVAACTRPAMHDDDRLAGERAVFLPIDPMLGKSGRRQMTGPDEGWVRRPVSPASFGAAVWVFASTEIISAIMEGRLRARAGRWQASLRQNRGRRRSVVQLDAHPAFCRSLESFRSPAPTPLRALTAN